MDQQLQDAVVAAVRRSVATVATERPGDLLAGFALLTDDSLETVSCMAVTREALLASGDADLLFQPTDWPLEPDWHAFDLAYSQLQMSAALPMASRT